jgi:cytochrome P450
MTAIAEGIAALDDIATRHFVPYVPPPRTKPLGQLAQLYVLTRNPIETWTQAHFELPVIAGPSLVGNVIVVNTPEHVRHVFVDNSDNYRKDALQQRVLSAGAREGSGTGLLSAEGDLWRRTRRTLAPTFTPRRVATFAASMRERAEARVNRWLKRRPGAILEIDREMTGVTYDILSATLFSDALADDAEGFERELMKLLDTIGRIHPFDVFDLPKWVPRIGQQQARKSRLWFESAISRLVERRLAQAGDMPNDFLSALLAARDPETGAGLTEAEVAANLFTFIAAGHETTARALAWTLYLLSKSPDWLSRCEAEADRAPDDPGAWLDAMPATRAAFEEAMRLFPSVPMMSRAAIANDRFGETPVPRGAVVVVAPYLIHRHRLLWDDPDAYNPERFMPGRREAIDRFAYLPFGAGPRVCIGAIFAMQEAVIVLGAILRRVRLEHVGKEPHPVHRITLRPEGRLTMRMRPRS